jgi:hypothetical protein
VICVELKEDGEDLEIKNWTLWLEIIAEKFTASWGIFAN